MTKFNPPGHITAVLRALKRAGHAAYLVGGCVRDTVLGKAPNDWDVATSARTDETARIFPKTALTGERYGTVTVILPECTVEVTTFRADGEYRDGRRPESVKFVGDLNDDLSRRDFTMNAMAISLDGELADPFGGVRDIAAGIIRCVGDPERRFREDALRMLRALRFSAQLGFTIEPDTLSAVKRLAGTACALSAERVRDELQKTLMSARPEIAGDMIRYGLFAGRVTASEKNVEKISRIAGLPCVAVMRLCAFCAVLAESGCLSSVFDFARLMRLDNKTASACAAGAELAAAAVPMGATDIKRLLARHSEAAVCSAAAAHEVLYNEPRLAAVDAVINSGECYRISGLAVSGADLIAAKIAPGKQLGAALSRLLEHVIEHPADNKRENLMALLEDG